uniref:Uncharacterized protein n=1 Tax=Opuntia streptacantha TaxID=393608 RepID=A0A7C9EP84_OPUST
MLSINRYLVIITRAHHYLQNTPFLHLKAQINRRGKTQHSNPMYKAPYKILAWPKKPTEHRLKTSARHKLEKGKQTVLAPSIRQAVLKKKEVHANCEGFFK